MPVRSPKREAHPASSRGIETQYRSSSLVGIQRLTLIPPLPGVVEPELGEGDAHLGCPAERVLVDARFPDRIVREVPPMLGVRRVVPVDPYTCSGHREGVGGTAIQVRVKRNGKRLDVPHLVSARHHLGDVRRVLVQHARRDVQGSAIVHEGDFRAFGRRCALLGLFLQEVGEEVRLAPGGVVQPAVDRDEVGVDAHGHRLFRRNRAVRGVTGVAGSLRERSARRRQRQDDKRHGPPHHPTRRPSHPPISPAALRPGRSTRPPNLPSIPLDTAN